MDPDPEFRLSSSLCWLAGLTKTRDKPFSCCAKAKHGRYIPCFIGCEFRQRPLLSKNALCFGDSPRYPRQSYCAATKGSVGICPAPNVWVLQFEYKHQIFLVGHMRLFAGVGATILLVTFDFGRSNSYNWLRSPLIV